MANPVKYIKALEAVGFERSQAEAQVQMVLDAIEDDLVTKSEFALFQERLENRLSQFQNSVQGLIDTKFNRFESRLDSRVGRIENRISLLEEKLSEFGQDLLDSEQRYDKRLLETEFRLLTRVGFLVVSTTTLAVAFLAWLIKV